MFIFLANWDLDAIIPVDITDVAKIAAHRQDCMWGSRIVFKTPGKSDLLTRRRPREVAEEMAKAQKMIYHRKEL